MEENDHLPPSLHIDPPLFNSANPWATTLEQLRDLYRCAATGAVTTRTALLEGFPHDEEVHRFAIFEAGTHRVSGGGDDENKDRGRGDASLNTLGYSPIPLDGYLGFIRRVDEEVNAEKGEGGNGKRKPFIVSVTGTPDEVAECYRRVSRCAREISIPLALEINLSCPNIPGKPPPAYEGEALRGYVRRVAEVVGEESRGDGETGGGGEKKKKKGEGFAIPWGVKTPPYTHAGQFDMFVSALRDCAVVLPGYGAVPICPLTFVTATNTLGSCLLLGGTDEGVSKAPTSPVLPGPGIGGLAGAPLHPLALGNVATLRRLLDADSATRHVVLLGIGGVADADGFRRMRAVGAAAVGVGTALGSRGVRVFGEIAEGLGGGGID
ncbi:FMN-linked oxidoreductase [Xylaria telfairii]|nr:FMN-linked oxidoreductase [Xylaria telfairii]